MQFQLVNYPSTTFYQRCANCPIHTQWVWVLLTWVCTYPLSSNNNKKVESFRGWHTGFPPYITTYCITMYVMNWNLWSGKHSLTLTVPNPPIWIRFCTHPRGLWLLMVIVNFRGGKFSKQHGWWNVGNNLCPYLVRFHPWMSTKIYGRWSRWNAHNY